MYEIHAAQKTKRISFSAPSKAPLNEPSGSCKCFKPTKLDVSLVKILIQLKCVLLFIISLRLTRFKSSPNMIKIANDEYVAAI